MVRTTYLVVFDGNVEIDIAGVVGRESSVLGVVDNKVLKHRVVDGVYSQTQAPAASEYLEVLKHDILAR